MTNTNSNSDMHSGVYNKANGTDPKTNSDDKLHSFYRALGLSQQEGEPVWRAVKDPLFGGMVPHYNEGLKDGIIIHPAAKGGDEHHPIRINGNGIEPYKVKKGQLHFGMSIVNNSARIFEYVIVLKKSNGGYAFADRVPHHKLETSQLIGARRKLPYPRS